MRSAVLLSVTLSACSGSVVRDRATYTTEIAWSASMHRAAAEELLRLAPSRATVECNRLADLGLTLRTRAPWHQAKVLELGGITDVDPGPPPPIPANETICGAVR